VAAARLARGFTLIELVVTIVLLGIISATIGVFIVPAMQGYEAQRQRSRLTDSTEGALRKIARDIRIAVPNSVRVTTVLVGATGFALELAPSADGGRYCVAGDANCDTRPEGANALLDVSAADGSFVVLGCFKNSTFVGDGGAGYRLVINNSAATDLYSAAVSNNVITPAAGTSVTVSVSPEPAAACGSASATPGIANVHRVQIAPGHDFLSDSARRRVFVVEKAAAPITYVCDRIARTLTRWSGYAFQTAQPNQPGAAPLLAANGRLVADNVSACDATSTALIQGAGLVTLDLGVSLNNETVRLVHQVQLDNSE
jgi:MSHA biogenesis protein MshO